jgi:hypothetical protein
MSMNPSVLYHFSEKDGQWISQRQVDPISVTPVRDLLAAHAQAAIELRLVPSMWPLNDIALDGDYDFSLVRMHNAQPRTSP